MDAHDRQMLAGLAKVNSEIGTVTLQLLTLQPDDANYAAGLRTLGRDLVRIGAQLAARAGELDGRVLDPVELMADPQPEAS
ncbi:hypothetical protein MUY14_26315 [Amycolatopsis sp. FBCC-B4732]|uniref:hypothetical protein n=1 Tax=Amycolatopsis sp. FBCC-B4732 TaxID=3079339 RepID=UPI001FF3638E|nr:hypothetical protein [Amycolatopsis sp. FBCC-B4732]UOX85306.1 hypothetical protein MUY14_26315 [Amycolatopsis sp. FBCC-B4732]